MDQMYVSALYRYPVKSLAGQSFQSLSVENRGFEHDRRWMLIDARGQKLTQRENGRMPFLLAEIIEGHLKLTDTRTQKNFQIPFSSTGDAITVDVWGTECDTHLVSEAADAWLSECLNQSVRIVYQPQSAHRAMDPKYARPQDKVSLADGYPFLLANTHSLADLSQRTGMELDMRRFRPNIVISGPVEAWAEDHWRDIRIGSVRFRGTKPCARCQIITIDPDTGIKGPEPLKTMAGFRKEGNKVLFGLNMIPESLGVISVGDSVQVF